MIYKVHYKLLHSVELVLQHSAACVVIYTKAMCHSTNLLPVYSLPTGAEELCIVEGQQWCYLWTQSASPEQFMIFNNLLTHRVTLEDAHPICVTDVAESLHAASQRRRDNFTPFQLVLTQHQVLFAPFTVHSIEVQF